MREWHLPGATKKRPHPEPVEGRIIILQRKQGIKRAARAGGSSLLGFVRLQPPEFVVEVGVLVAVLLSELEA
jgi:hypothetical protein